MDAGPSPELVPERVSDDRIAELVRAGYSSFVRKPCTTAKTKPGGMLEMRTPRHTPDFTITFGTATL